MGIVFQDVVLRTAVVILIEDMTLKAVNSVLLFILNSAYNLNIPHFL